MATPHSTVNDPAKTMQDRLERGMDAFTKARKRLWDAQSDKDRAEYELVAAVSDAGLTHCLRLNVSRLKATLGK